MKITATAIAGALLATIAGCEDRHRIGSLSGGGADGGGGGATSVAVVTSTLALDKNRSGAMTSSGRAFRWGKKLPIGDVPPDPTLFDTTPVEYHGRPHGTHPAVLVSRPPVLLTDPAVRLGPTVSPDQWRRRALLCLGL